MRELGWNLGGEKSGHIILSDLGPTGDGLIVALQLIALCVTNREIWDSVRDELVFLPQLHAAVEVSDPQAFAQRTDVKTLIRLAVQGMSTHQRVIARPSGTEPVYRIMVEGPNEVDVRDTLEKLKCELDLLADRVEQPSP